MAINRKIAQKLSEWAELGLISREQQQSIEAHEIESESKYGFLFGLGLFAASCVALGIIALIASNWDDIPGGVKLLVFFLSFAGLGAVFVWREKNSSLIKEILRIGLMAMILGGIGLVAQVYHLHSSPWKGLAFWCLASFLLALGSTSIWGGALWLSLGFWTLLQYLDSLHLQGTMITVILTLCLGSIGALASLPSQRFPELQNFRKVGFAYAVIATIFFTLSTAYKFAPIMDVKVYSALLAMFALWGIAFTSQTKLYSKAVRFCFTVFLLAAACQVLILPYFHDGDSANTTRKLISTFFFVFGTLGLALSAFYAGSRRTFEMLCLFIFVRLLFFYAEVFLSLAMSGFALISMGIMIFAGLSAWQKWKKDIFAKLEKKSHG